MVSALRTVFVLYILSPGIPTEALWNWESSSNNNRQASGSRYNQQSNLKQGNIDEGCPSSQLTFKCEFGQQITGRLQYNRCRYYDPRPQTGPDGLTYMCGGEVGGTTPGFRCQFCCKEQNSVVPSCSLRFERSVDVNRPPPPASNSHRHCIGSTKGNLCNQAGDCNRYCCSEETWDPCLTPLCPADVDSTTPVNDDVFTRNLQVIRNQCSFWQGKGDSSLARGTLSLQEWNRRQ